MGLLAPVERWRRTRARRPRRCCGPGPSGARPSGIAGGCRRRDRPAARASGRRPGRLTAPLVVPQCVSRVRRVDRLPCQHGRHEVWTRPDARRRGGAPRDGRMRSGGRRAARRPPSRRPTAPTHRQRRPRRRPRHGARRAGEGPAAARRRAPADARDAGALHAVGADRRRHRRLPLLPARPEARPRTPGSPAPTCCPATPTSSTTSSCSGSRRTRSRRPRAAGRRTAGRGLDLLRRHRPRTRSRASTTRRGSAPGRPAAARRCTRHGYGVQLDKGSRIVMQVHYNLLAGDDAGRLGDPAAARPGRRRPHDAHTCCCRRRSSCPAGPSTTTAPLCDRDAAVADVKKRFGDGPGSTADLLLLPVRRRAAARRRPVLHPHHPRADDDPRRRRPHAPARPLDQDRGQPGHRPGADRPGHPGLGLRQPGRQADRAGARSTPATPSR